MKELKEFIRFHIANSRFKTVVDNIKDFTSPIVESIKELSSKIENRA